MPALIFAPGGVACWHSSLPPAVAGTRWTLPSEYCCGSGFPCLILLEPTEGHWWPPVAHRRCAFSRGLGLSQLNPCTDDISVPLGRTLHAVGGSSPGCLGRGLGGAGARGGGITAGATSRASPLAASAKRGARARLRPFPRPPLCPLPWGPPGRGGAVGEGRSGTRWVGQVGGVSPGVPRTAEGPPPWAHAAHPAFPTGEHHVWLTCHVVHACMPHPPAWSVGARPKVGEP